MKQLTTTKRAKLAEHIRRLRLKHYTKFTAKTLLYTGLYFAGVNTVLLGGHYYNQFIDSVQRADSVQAVAADNTISEPSKVKQATPETPKTPRYSGPCDKYRALVGQYDWDVDTALAIMQAESGCDTNATGTNSDGTSDRGLFQINDQHRVNNPYNPADNIRSAYQIYLDRASWDGDGWKAWTVYNNGKYKEFMR